LIEKTVHYVKVKLSIILKFIYDFLNTVHAWYQIIIAFLASITKQFE
jgi:hypothetical protein